MVSKNIAFVGAPGVDKTILQMKAADILDGEYRYRVTNRIEKKVIDSINENRIDLSHFDQEIDIISAFIRRSEILAVNSDCSVIADEWVLQELANTMVKMNNLQEKLKTAAQVLGPDGKKKLSKRDGAKDILEYKDEGYLPETLLNFLATLGWNDGTTQEVFSKEELISKFDIKRVNKSGAKFDEQRLLWLNGHYIRETGTSELLEKTKDFWPKEAENFDEEYKLKFLGLIK